MTAHQEEIYSAEQHALVQVPGEYDLGSDLSFALTLAAEQNNSYSFSVV